MIKKISELASKATILYRKISPIPKFILKAFIFIVVTIGGYNIYTWEINKSNRSSTLYEFQFARDMLGYTVSQKMKGVRNRPSFSLKHCDKASEAFAGNPLKDEILSLCNSLSSAQKSAEDLWNSNPQTVSNRIGDINRAIFLADKVGPKLANDLSSFWETKTTWIFPPPNMTNEESIEYFQNARNIFPAVATDAPPTAKIK